MCKYINDYYSLKFKDTCGSLMEEGMATHSPGIHAWRIPRTEVTKRQTQLKSAIPVPLCAACYFSLSSVKIFLFGFHQLDYDGSRNRSF